MMNKVILIGNLGSDPEMRYFPDGSAVTNFSLATNRKWKDPQSGEPVQETTWFRVAVTGKQAEACAKYLVKGRQVYVEGRLKADRQTGAPKLWTADDGSVRATFEVQAFMVNFLGAKDDADGDGGAAPGGQIVPMEEDEIPF